MRHDDLTDAINRQILIAPTFALNGYVVWLHALRAVMELHRPDKSHPTLCKGCWVSYGSDTNEYPCETIKTIEKALTTNVDN